MGRADSDAEAALAFQMRAVRLDGWVREHQFDPVRRWRFDFAFPDAMLAVEVEGGLWVAGRHTRGGGYEADLEKYAAATIAGWRVLRVSPAMVDDGRAVGYVERALRGTSGKP